MDGESLAIYSGINMNRRYLYGITFMVMTDHSALLSLYNKPNRSALARVERHRSRLRNFDFKVDYCPGEEMPCDCGSRHPMPAKKGYTKTEKEQLGIEQEEEDAEIWISRIVDEYQQAITMEQLQTETQRDEQLKKLLPELQTNKKSKETSKGPYGKVFEDLREWNGVIRRGDRVVMPKSLQPER